MMNAQKAKEYTIKHNKTISNLLRFDFMLLKQNYLCNYSKNFIDIDYLIGSLKQFSIAITGLFSQYKTAKVLLVAKDKTEQMYIERCLAKLDIVKYVQVITELRQVRMDNTPKILVLLYHTSFRTSSKTLAYRMSRMNAPLIFNITVKISEDDCGIYSIFNQINSLHKILFLLLVIKQAILKKDSVLFPKETNETSDSIEENSTEKIVCE